jgi:hypothetical protein
MPVLMVSASIRWTSSRVVWVARQKYAGLFFHTISPLGLGDELLYPSFDVGLNSRDYVRAQGSCQFVHELAVQACARSKYVIPQAGVFIHRDQGQEPRAEQLGNRIWGLPEHGCPEVWDSCCCLVDQGAELGHHWGSLGRGGGTYHCPLIWFLAFAGGTYHCPLIWFLAFAGHPPHFQEVPLDSRRASGITCMGAGLELHGMIQASVNLFMHFLLRL